MPASEITIRLTVEEAKFLQQKMVAVAENLGILASHRITAGNIARQVRYELLRRDSQSKATTER